MVLPNLYKLADKDYKNRHQFFVDSTPTVSDAYIGGAWRTLLVGGLGAGGRGYYALDVTDPTQPKALWEFSDNNLGLSFGRPEITKLKDGTWVVIAASGYNNVSPGDGHGRLFVLNAASGALIRSIDTGEGSTAVPSGLANIRAYVDSADLDNTALRVYGGDTLGNVWRFDINNDTGASGYDAQLLATLLRSDGTAQPVTSRPELASVAGSPFVYVGTGRYLGITDLADSKTQSIYGIKDTLGSTSYGSPRLDTRFIRQTLTDSTCPSGSTICSPTQAVRLGSNNAVNPATDAGWYVDLPASYERANTDPQLALGTLVFTTNIVDPSACDVGGRSYINFFDYRTGGSVSTATGVTSVLLGNAIATRPAVVRLPNGNVVSLTRLSDDRTITSPVPIGTTSTTTRRVSWRELPSDK
jgi:type IV pilus assembly protein PilY1